ncbi:MAG: hypothetical protein HUU10_09040 [Bacteroidetes bacterium]|nr:hypothetical protein [Bacteroidota bacterium]
MTRMIPQIFLLIIGFLFAAPLSGYGQLFTGRSQMTIPDSSLPVGWLPGLGLSAEMNSGYGSVAEEQAWNYKLQGTIYFARLDSWILSGTLTHEQSANPYSDINFNPKRAWWTETINLSYLTTDYIIQTGIFHRCKHDIDNAEATNPEKPEPVSTQRGPIVTGLHLTVLSSPQPLLRTIQHRWGGSLNYHLFGSDYRNPSSEEINRIQPRLDESVGSVWALSRLDAPVLEWLNAYQRIWLQAVFFERDEPGFNSRLEWGLRLKGLRGNLDAFGGYESTFDDVALNTPRPTDWWFLGLRVSGLGWE